MKITVAKERPKQYLVEADHPVLRRVFDIYNEEQEALDFIEDIKGFKYENITLNGKDV